MSQQPDSYDKPEPKRMTRNVPPLVWVILAVLIGVFVVGALQRRQTNPTPQGEQVPAVVESQGVIPAAPATGDAPATPGGVRN